MCKRLLLPTLLLLLAYAGNPAYAQTEYSAILSGSNEVPANTSTATGSISASLDGTTLTVTGAFDGLSSAYAASHLHLGLAGQNGGVEVGLNPTVAGDGLSGTYDEEVTLDEAQMAALEARSIYVNVHSANHPGGEIRGQMVPGGHDVFRAILSGGNAVPANASAAAGVVIGDLDPDTGMLTVTGSFSGLRAAYTVSHLHMALAGRAGGVEVPLMPTLDEDNLGGTFVADSNMATLSSEQVEALRARRLYANIHSEYRPGGELRGQMIPSSSVEFRAVLSGRAESPTPNASMAMGAVVAELTPDDSVIVTGGFSGLGSAYNASHLHLGALGVAGGVEIPLTVTADDDSLGGVFEAADNSYGALTEAQLTALMEGMLYANVHSANLGSGEIRGQVLPAADHVFEAYLSGSSEVPPVETEAMGAAIVVLDPDSMLTLAGSFSGLGSAYSASHLHIGPVEGTGGVSVPLTATPDGDNLGGTWAAGDNQTKLTAEQYAALWEEMMYANVHSADNGGGEIRGQVVPSTNVGPTAPPINTPADGASVTIEGDPESPFTATWGCPNGCDPNANPVKYTWELAADAGFVLSLVDSTTTDTTFESTFGEVAALLTQAGVQLNSSITVYHRVTASDGNFEATGPGSSVTLTRGAITDTEDGAELPEHFAVLGNYPNPFNPSTSIRFDLPQAAQVSVAVYDMLGRQVMALPARAMAPGAAQALTIDASQLSSGLYFYRVTAEMGGESLIDTGTMTLIK